MSTAEKANLDLFFKGFISVMLAICGMFLYKTLDKVEVTYERMIRVEVAVDNLEKIVGTGYKK